MAARHEQWVVELLGGLTQEEQQTMISELWKLKTHVNGTAPITRKGKQRSQSGEAR
jgi:hypothetical protein